MTGQAAEVEWRRMRSDQLRSLAKQEAIIIVPVAALEQHGPHLPVEVDMLLGDEVALRTARLMQAQGAATAVLPALWTGISEHHMSFGGTVALDYPAFAALVEGVCVSVVRQGFRRLVILNAHGGNQDALRSITRTLTPKLDVEIVQLTYWLAVPEVVAAQLTMQKNVGHACEAETSMMMALRPELVATEAIPNTQANTTGDMVAQLDGLYRWRTMEATTPTGVLGSPEAATAEKGLRLLEAISTRLATRLLDPALWAIPWRAPSVSTRNQPA